MFKTYEKISEKTYDHYLGCVPPAVYLDRRFLVGEAEDHRGTHPNGMQGAARFQACFQVGDEFYASSAPMTVHEFRMVVTADIEKNIVANDTQHPEYG